ncbi:hypothetical protein ACJX0J_030028, partial [Zea mays]
PVSTWFLSTIGKLISNNMIDLDALYFLVVTAFFEEKKLAAAYSYFSGAYSYILFYANLLLLQLMHNFLFIVTQRKWLNCEFSDLE